MAYVLQHKTETHRQITCADFKEVQALYYRQWRADDGSIPWRIIWEDTFEINPVDGTRMGPFGGFL